MKKIYWGVALATWWAASGTSSVPGQVVDVRARTALLSQAAPIESNLPVQLPEFIEFTLIRSEINAGDLGGPEYHGIWRPPDTEVAQIELRSTTGVGMKYENGSDLRNERDGQTLATQWETAVRGAGYFQGQPFNDARYSHFCPTSVGGEGREGDVIEFAPSPDPSCIKGLQARVAVSRNGLRDGAGTYKSSVTLSWYKF